MDRAVVIILVIAALSAGALASPTVSLPPISDQNDLLLASQQNSRQDDVSLKAGAVVAGLNNVGSLWDIAESDQLHRQFTDHSAYAILQYSAWTRVNSKGWLMGYGSGLRDAYSGNADAARLWIDLNSDHSSQVEYLPSAENARVDIHWIGFGRDFPLSIRKLKGSGSVFLRRLETGEYLTRSIYGQVQGESFSGMMRTTSSETQEGSVKGRGWCLDVDFSFSFGDRWYAKINAEGLFGFISWKGLVVEDSYIVSPGVFTDPDGFLRDFGGISGASWREDIKRRINPYYRLDVLYKENPNLLFGISYQDNVRTVADVGLAWPGRKAVKYFRCYPSQKRLELGIVAHRYQVRMSGDDWLTSSPTHAEIAVCATPLRF